MALHPPLSAGPAGGWPYARHCQPVGVAQKEHLLLCLSPESPPTSGLARKRRRRVMQLDRESAFYASRRRLRTCGSEGAVEGRSAGRGVCSLRRAPLTFCLARRRRRRGADREFAFYASCRRHRAWPGGGGSGARAGRRYFFPCLTPPTLGLARSGQGRGAQLDGLTFGLGMETVWRQRGAGLDDELAFFGSRRESAPTSGLTRRWRWWGALPWPGVCFSIFHSPAS